MQWDLLRLLAGIPLIAGLLTEVQEPSKKPPQKPGEVVIEPASVTAGELGKVDFELGTLYVPENRAGANSRLIGVGFARFRAEPRTDAPPIFLLPGGPGSSYLSDLKPGNSSRPRLLKNILRYRAIGDVVLVDQRGFSERGEVLKFRHVTPNEPLDQPASLERSTASFTAMARAAVAEFSTKGIDLRGYTVKECADDVNDLRKALGYERIMLMGGSFGSQWSFAVMRRHPAVVVRALLGGVEPLDCGYDMPSHVMAAVQRMWWEAEQDPRLKPYLPPGGLMAATREVLQRLQREPVRVPLAGVIDAKTGVAVAVTLGHEDVQRAAALRNPEGPAFILSLYHGRYEQLAFATNLARRSRPQEFPLIPVLIDTSLGVTPRRKHLLRTDPATAILGHWNFDSYLATAELWPSPDVGDEFRTEVVSSIPVVFVSGDWDTQTPIENTLQIAPYFPKGHVLIVERGGHGAMNQVAQHLPETMDALLAFLKTGNSAGLPTKVAVPGPKFTVPSFPPPGR
jgi:pimeloyl-ACP methyl ester carboxylesterase